MELKIARYIKLKLKCWINTPATNEYQYISQYISSDPARGPAPEAETLYTWDGAHFTQLFVNNKGADG